jgi:hypothetical protein
VTIKPEPQDKWEQWVVALAARVPSSDREIASVDR